MGKQRKQIKQGILVIGYGNTLRSDDAIGQIIAKELETANIPQVSSIYVHQLTPELAEKIAKFEAVIFIDGSINQDQVKLIPIKINQANNNNWTHYLNPESLINLTESVYQKKSLAWLISIPIINLDFGENLSNFAQQGKNIALLMIKNLIQEILGSESELLSKSRFEH